ncbi:AAA family ATPase [Candidatus Kaiserbacteria bacterium]|nr:AAA family ATPase [Candidatus Kaiserbacteria bacterium]
MKQEEALKVLKTGMNVFLTGEPGSGKTHTINRYIAWLRERGVEVSVTASTGIAATHVGGMTIHSWSGIGVKRDLTDWDIEMIHSREKTAKRILDAKVLVIDEVSMLDGAVLASVDKVLRSLRKKPLTHGEPFGGLQVIFVGDFFQLPPVSRDARASFAFESDAWKAANPIVCYLSEQHRQDDPDFLDMLGALRRGTFGAAHLKRLKSRTGILPKKEVATRLYTHNADVDRINAESLAKIPGDGKRYVMQSKGAGVLVDALKNNCLSPENLDLKSGAAVMFTRNNFEAGYVNGTLGTVTGFAVSGYPIVKIASGKSITAEPQEWAIQDGTKILAKITQVPLRLAWAITVHKSQGMSLDAAIIDLGQAFEYGQGYVAISRVRSLEGLYLESFNERSLMLHPKVVDKDTYFRASAAAAQQKFATLAREEIETLEKNFLRAIGAQEPSVRKPQSPGKSSLDALREKYPNVGKPWTKDNDVMLTTMFNAKRPNAEIAKHFQRRPSAIQARLAHLGLIPDIWKPRKK